MFLAQRCQKYPNILRFGTGGWVRDYDLRAGARPHESPDPNSWRDPDAGHRWQDCSLTRERISWVLGP